MLMMTLQIFMCSGYVCVYVSVCGLDVARGEDPFSLIWPFLLWVRPGGPLASS